MHQAGGGRRRRVCGDSWPTGYSGLLLDAAPSSCTYTALPSPPLPSPPLVLPPENMFSLTQGKDKNTFMPVVVHAEGHVRQYMKRDINMLR